jgi:hypothetical protein
MAGLDPAIHILGADKRENSWMPGTRPGMTTFVGTARHAIIAA